MLTIRTFTCENQRKHCVTDAAAPRFGFSLDSDRAGAALAKAVLFYKELVQSYSPAAPAKSEHRQG